MEYKIVDNQSTSENPTSNVILKQIHQVLDNLVRTYNIKDTYIDQDCPWYEILAAATFTIFSTAKMLKGCSLVQLLFVHDMILLINTYSGLGINISEKSDAN